jgi:pimeloyl-ACP methyl ester carboxylesterase
MRRRLASKAAAIAALSSLLWGCTHFGVDDCPKGEHWYAPSVLGKDTPRVRSSNLRMELGNQYRAAARFAPYALMSAYAYFDKPSCEGRNPRKTDTDDAIKIKEELNALGPAGAFVHHPELEKPGGCEDGLGLMYHVWHYAPKNEIVIAFRGTSTPNDWWYGNLWPLSRGLSKETQYSEVRQQVAEILAQIKQNPGLPKDAKIIVAGHSLGGGLAQHALYSYPTSIHQAIVFDPSIWTGYTSIEGAERVTYCNCANDLGAEAPIIRVYESYEILSNLRIFHKTFFPPHLHIQEVRFTYNTSRLGTAGHNMADLARALGKDALDSRAGSDAPWYASSVKACTEDFKREHVASCVEAAKSNVCQAPVKAAPAETVRPIRRTQ